jgi:hypothetical protein
MMDNYHYENHPDLGDMADQSGPPWVDENDYVLYEIMRATFEDTKERHIANAVAAMPNQLEKEKLMTTETANLITVEDSSYDGTTSNSTTKTLHAARAFVSAEVTRWEEKASTLPDYYSANVFSVGLSTDIYYNDDGSVRGAIAKVHDVTDVEVRDVDIVITYGDGTKFTIDLFMKEES